MNIQHETVATMAAAVRNGDCSPDDLVQASLRTIEEREAIVGAWTFLDRTTVSAQVEDITARLRNDSPEDIPLAGIPVGVKDIFDTCDMPTENGTSAHKGRRPDKDAAVVAMLRQAGAIVIGKTVTAELAVYSPGKTTNPHDPLRTPGGSSSGSAAAVAAGMVPLALGTQTNGSVIRPASYCGVVGFKPTYGSLPRAGVLRQSPSLDQIGVFSRNVADSAMLVSVLANRDTICRDTVPWPAIDLSAIHDCTTLRPRIAFAKTPVWSQAHESVQDACRDFCSSLPVEVVELELPEVCNQAVSCHRTIMLAEMYYNYTDIYDNFRGHISTMLLSMLEEGAALGITEYLQAKTVAEEITEAVDCSLQGFDAVLTPATPSEAPVGLQSTGSPVFCTIWSLCGVPAITLPLLKGESGMPLGIQLVGARGTDTQLLRTANWLEAICAPNR